MRRNSGSASILQKLKEGPVLGDGGYLLGLEKRGWVRAGPFTPEVAFTNPEALRQLHIEFREAGAEVLQALTFYASRDKLATVGLQDRLEDLNRAAVRIAKEVAGGSPVAKSCSSSGGPESGTGDHGCRSIVEAVSSCEAR
jgi:betaine-homocysteine S-methyltransferase